MSIDLHRHKTKKIFEIMDGYRRFDILGDDYDDSSGHAHGHSDGNGNGNNDESSNSVKGNANNSLKPQQNSEL